MSTEVAFNPAIVESYECSLNDDTKAVALQELREDDKIREEALEQFRDWIKKHPGIKKCRTDANFLLRFLRNKKFSVHQASEMLEKYLVVRETYPQWFKNLDINDPEIENIIDQGYLIPLIKRDSMNRKVTLVSLGRFDPHKHTADQMARTHTMVSELMLEDELNQIYGFSYINDESGMQMGHLTLWSLQNIKTVLECTMSAIPVRHKESHFINIPTYANKILDFTMSILSDKLKKRIFLHKNIDDIKKTIDLSNMPKEYGGDVPMADLIKTFKEELRSKRDVLLALDEMSIDVKLSKFKIDAEMAQELGTGVVGSFRKLQVD